VLDLRDVVCCYGQVTALKGVSLTVGKGELVALIGANGAGKSTTLKAISGLLHPIAGTIVFDGHDITNAAARAILSLGIAHCPEGRRVFPQMTVMENLEMALTCAALAARSPPTWRACSISFRGSPSAASSRRGPCRAASSRCSRSVAR